MEGIEFGGASTASGTSHSGAGANAGPGTGRRRAVAACGRCKSKKKRCDGNLPVCGRCVEARASCQYYGTQLQVQQSDMARQTDRVAVLEAQMAMVLGEMRELRRAQGTVGPSGPESVPVDPELAPNLGPSDPPGPSLAPKMGPSGPIRPEPSASGSAGLVGQILRLVHRPMSTKISIGQAAVLSKVQAIRRILTKDKATDLSPTEDGGDGGDVGAIGTIGAFAKVERLHSDPPTGEVEDIFLQCYLTFCRNRYHFVERSEIYAAFAVSADQRSPWAAFVTAMCLANGCRVAELAKLAMQPSPRYYLDRALEHLQQIPHFSPHQQVQTYMLVALYLHYTYDYHDNFVSNVWELSRLAIEKMASLGYHQERSPTLDTCVEVEVQKRMFWSVYAFDRLLSVSLGRGSNTEGLEITVPFPLSVEDLPYFDPIPHASPHADPHSLGNPHFHPNAPNAPEPQQILALQRAQAQAQARSDPSPAQPVTSITYLVETCKIREIEGKINKLAYPATSQASDLAPGQRSGPPGSAPSSDGAGSSGYESLNQSLEKWVANIPSKKDFSHGLRKEVSYEYMLLLYHRARLFLLLPQITTLDQSGSRHAILKDTMQAAGSMCQCFKTIHKDSLFGYSTFSLHTIFLAGVTLVYCVWAMGNPPSVKAHNDIRACSNVLYSFSERTSEAESYRVLFENLIERVLYDEEVEFGYDFEFDDFWRQITS